MPPAPLGGFDGAPEIPSDGTTPAALAPLEYVAPQGVRDIIASLGRTEDLSLSPTGRRLAIASAVRNRIILIDLEISAAGGAPQVALTHALEISSACLKYPHGVEFVDDRTLIVANRHSGVAIFDLPAAAPGVHAVELEPTRVLANTEAAPLQRPGSIAVLGSDAARCEILVCNNSGHNVTRHVLDRGKGYTATGGEILLEKWLDIPDGIAASRDRRWIAISNHNGHCVMLYENRAGLGPQAGPDGILRGVRSPHGLCFDADGRTLFVADAGAPYVHVYADEGREWRGVHYPVASLCVIDREEFLRGRYNAREGGPKGVDVDRTANVMVITSEFQPLAFFAVAPLQADAPDDGARSLRYEIDALGQLADVYRRVRAAEIQAKQMAAMERKATRRLDSLKRSASWRLTAPLRWIRAALRRPS